MMLIKVKLQDDEIVTRINGTIEEIAEYYFPKMLGKDVLEIEVLEDGVTWDNEYMTQTVTRIYRAPESDIREFGLRRDQDMKLIKVKLQDDEIVTRTNGTIEEIAEYYFPKMLGKDVLEIEIFEGGVTWDNEYMTQTGTRIYRAPESDIREFRLWNNIR